MAASEHVENGARGPDPSLGAGGPFRSLAAAPPVVRLLLYPVLLAAAAGVALSLGGVVDRRLPDSVTSVFRLGWLLSFIAATLTTLLLRRWWDRRRDRLGLTFMRGWTAMLISGAVVGATIQSVLWWSLDRSGNLHADLAIPLSGGLAAILVQAGMLLVHAVFEETTFRGYIFQNLREAAGPGVAFWLTCLLFALTHVVDPGGRQPLVLVNLFFAGAVMGYAYLATGSLWTAVGLHFAWNLFEGPVYGMTVSGHTLASLVVSRIHGPAWVTGAAFGPEASVWLLPAEAVGALLLWGVYGRVYGRLCRARGGESIMSDRQAPPKRL